MSEPASDSATVRILHSDHRLIAVHKPAGISFHSDDHSEGVVGMIRRLHGQALYPVHRLDRMTSGLMVFARDKESNRALSELFASRQIEKYYLAISATKPQKKQGSIVGDMAKARRGSFKLLRSRESPAVTRFFSKPFKNNGSQRAAFLLKPETGKTHQLRVALKSLGSPILGDVRYGAPPSDRGYLHAWRLSFLLDGRCYDVQDPVMEGEEWAVLARQVLFNDWHEPYRLSWPKGSVTVIRDGLNCPAANSCRGAPED